MQPVRGHAKSYHSSVPSASSIAASKPGSSTVRVNQPSAKPCQGAAKSVSRLPGASQPAQTLQVQLLPFPKLFMPLSSQLAKVHTHCMPGLCWREGTWRWLNVSMTLEQLGARGGRQWAGGTAKLHSACQRHFSVGSYPT